MKYISLIYALLICTFCLAQNITVDSQSLTPQELIEDILIDSDCIENVVVTNAVSGDFGGTEFSYGTFDATGTTFPFERGIVLSTGRLSNVPGPNNSLSDDDAPGWNGDDDLEFSLQETGTTNATIIEFNFTAITNQISFRYLFASEEYQENNPNTCNFSDLFGFLVREAGTNDPYENVALVPGTNTPVKVTTVTPGITGSCPPLNEDFFGQFNQTVSPINFNGQTDVLVATATLIPNVEYNIKLVIADEFNARFDSAVFLEAGSFELTRDLGENRLQSSFNPLCENETLILDATIAGNNGYDWFRNGMLVQSDPIGCTNCGTFEVTQDGTYTVEVTLDNSCVANGEIIIEYATNPVASNTQIIECDSNQDGLTIYDLFAANDAVTNNDNNLYVTDFFLSEQEAIDDTNPILNPNSFENTIPNQIVFARVENPFGCFDIAEVVLQISNNILNIPIIESCDFDDIDGFTTFNLNDATMAIENQIPINADVTYYETENDAFFNQNPLNLQYENIVADAQTIFVRVDSNNDCFAISEVNLEVLFTPEISDDETVIYCTNTFPETIRLQGGVLNDLPNNYFYEWQLNGTTIAQNTFAIDINEIGVYTVIITDPNGCSNTRDITVNPSEIAENVNIDVVGADNLNTITVTIDGAGNYQFALDNENGPYQDSNIFNNITSGFHTVFVRDINGCGIASKIFSVLGFPKFFTPNGDGQNDTWQLKGINFELYPNLQVSIFDRFGKLITLQNANSSGWDGTYNGNRLPNSDYWFSANFGDGKTFTGHFALKR
ncbi:choice-of-anchor L domain-containing protein [Winogradskyella litorisediminis]|uniref:Choice-of-anchor L domain-containing protein n=1 Tax=Winogradskyella litorisediminis TaxID=1156618 RepID=A0ABW3N8Y5_9FLAO